MQVYKAILKIILKNLPQLIIYVAVFLFVAVFLTDMYTGDPINADFTETKINIVFINNDKDSKLVDGLKKYLSQNTNFVDIPDKRERLQDALFFRKVEYIVRIPEGFSESFMKGKPISIDKIAVPNSTSSILIDGLINKYLNTAKIYIENMKSLSEEELIKYINNDLKQKAEVMIFNRNIKKTINEKLEYYFNYLAYSLLAILILGVSEVMIVFNNDDLKKRNLCSPLKLKNMNFQMTLGNISFAVLTWFIMVFMSFIMHGSYMFTIRGLFFMLNSFILTLSALSISFLISNIVKSKNAIAAVANVFCIGTCFISGVFIPQDFIGKMVLKIASFTPVYWYVNSNKQIANVVNFKAENITPIFINMLIILGFAVAALAVALTIIKQKRVSV